MAKGSWFMVDVAEEVINLGADLSTFFFFIRKADSEAIVWLKMVFPR